MKTYVNAEVVHWMGNRGTHILLPAHVDIDLTNICNQDCYYCNSAIFRATAPVYQNIEDYYQLIDRLASWRGTAVKSYGTTHSISYPGGGEPTVYPGYQNVIEHTIDSGFLCSLTTNGSKLGHLVSGVSPNKLSKMAWIGVDIDAGNQETYEVIRRSLSKISPFNAVVAHSRELVAIGANVDFKILLGEHNSSPKELASIFELSKNVGVRMVYFRPAIINGIMWPITPELEKEIQNLSARYSVPHRINTGKGTPRNYKRCHQMFHFPVFAADGKIYLCCENRGNPEFMLGSWVDGDFRDLWCGPRHNEVYNKINVALCPPCRPNKTNIEIQDIINNPGLLEVLYL